MTDTGPPTGEKLTAEKLGETFLHLANEQDAFLAAVGRDADRHGEYVADYVCTPLGFQLTKAARFLVKHEHLPSDTTTSDELVAWVLEDRDHFLTLITLITGWVTAARTIDYAVQNGVPAT